MASGRDLGFEPSILNLQQFAQKEISVSKRFKLRLIDLAKQGTFGGIRTRKASLQNSQAHLLSLLDNPLIPIFIYGEPGAGKRRHVQEFLTMHNFHRRLEGREFGKLRVFRGDFVASGFTAQWTSPQVLEGDVVYFEKIDQMSPECQQELLEFLSLRKKMQQSPEAQFRIIVGTEKALSIMVLKNQFSRELFQALSAFGIFLPSLNERAEDIPNLIQSVIEELNGDLQNPPAWLVDTLSRALWPNNFDDFRKFLGNILARKPKLKDWTPHDLPEGMRPLPPKKTFRSDRPRDLTQEINEKKLFQRALLNAGGNRVEAAKKLGIPLSDLLKKLMILGLR